MSDAACFREWARRIGSGDISPSAGVVSTLWDWSTMGRYESSFLLRAWVNEHALYGVLRYGGRWLACGRGVSTNESSLTVQSDAGLQWIGLISAAVQQRALHAFDVYTVYAAVQYGWRMHVQCERSDARSYPCFTLICQLRYLSYPHSHRLISDLQ